MIDQLEQPHFLDPYPTTAPQSKADATMSDSNRLDFNFFYQCIGVHHGSDQGFSFVVFGRKAIHWTFEFR
jgi:hypothetical protein